VTVCMNESLSWGGVSAYQGLGALSGGGQEGADAGPGGLLLDGAVAGGGLAALARLGDGRDGQEVGRR